MSIDALLKMSTELNRLMSTVRTSDTASAVSRSNVSWYMPRFHAAVTAGDQETIEATLQALQVIVGEDATLVYQSTGLAVYCRRIIDLPWALVQSASYIEMVLSDGRVVVTKNRDGELGEIPRSLRPDTVKHAVAKESPGYDTAWSHLLDDDNYEG